MLSTYFAKPWLEIGVGYQAGRRVNLGLLGIDLEGQRGVLNPMLHSDEGYATCYVCPEIGTKQFRKRHTLAKFITQHRHCGKLLFRGDFEDEPRDRAASTFPGRQHHHKG